MANSGEHVLGQLEAYCRGELSGFDRERVRQHLANCVGCRAAIEVTRQRGGTAPRPDEIFPSQIHKITWSTFGKVFGATLLVALLLGILQAYSATLKPPPYDLRLLGQNELRAGAASSVRVIVCKQPSGEALEGVPVRVELLDQHEGRAELLADFETDAQGTGRPQFQLPDWKDGDYLLHVVAEPGNGTEEITHTVKLRRSVQVQVLVRADKPLYQPGQVVHLRCLALRKHDRKPSSTQEAVFTITDPKGNMIFRRKGQTSTYGIASTNCPLAEEILEGNYQIQCQVGDATDSTTVEIKKYVLPRLKVELTLDRGYYQPGETLLGTVRAHYFFGKPVVNGAVTITFAKSVGQPEKIPTLALQTDANGTARFSLPLAEKLLGNLLDPWEAPLAIHATVTDDAGQEQDSQVACSITNYPIRIEVIPESKRLAPGMANTVYLLTTYPDGQPAPSRLAVTSFAEKIVTDALGLATVEITPTNDPVEWDIQATDAQGRKGQRQIKLQLSQAGEECEFLIRPDKAVYDSGDILRLTIVGGGTTPVFVDLLKDGQTLRTESTTPTDGVGEITMRLDPGLSGTFEWCAYRYDLNGLPLRRTRVLYVRPRSRLQVQAQLDRPEYRPGEHARIKLKLADNKGAPARGVISLAAVDSAVQSLSGQQLAPDQVSFATDPNLLRSVSEIFPWSPLLPLPGKSEDNQRLEQALFARTANRTGEVDRDELLQQILPFLEGDRRALRVLERGDWQELLDHSALSEDTKALLRNARSKHTLSVRTYPAKQRETERSQRSGQETMETVWTIYGFAAVILLLITGGLAAFGEDKLLGCVLTIAVGLCLICVLLPATQKVREAANRMSSSNALRELGLAVENFRAEQGKLPGPKQEQANPAGGAAVRVRHWFPETLLWQPEVITDDHGQASLDVPLADSITTWHLTANAVSATSGLGDTQATIRVFQPFFVEPTLPATLTRGDEIALPVVIYNYLDKPQAVEVTLKDADWFERQNDAVTKVELPAGDVRAVHFRLRARKVGSHELELTARGSGVGDTVRRTIEVVPDGRRVEKIVSGTLQEPAAIDLVVPPDAIEGSAKTILRVYPTRFSMVVEGLDSILQMPHGCFEQASSTTYPNVLALDYLRSTHKSIPAIEVKAGAYIDKGYQRLVSFEVGGGGFDWFGQPPANRTLTAYGLMEFEDMARVHSVDPALIQRTRQWLLQQRQADGSWLPESHRFHDDPSRGHGLNARLAATAYIAWAVFGGGKEQAEAGITRGYLLEHAPASIGDPYTLAIVCNALLALEPRSAGPYLDRLEGMKHVSDDKKRVWWSTDSSERTMFYGAGRSGAVETTALASLALVAANRSPSMLRGALTWLIEQRDRDGAWQSTQATVLALKALLAGSEKTLGAGDERRVALSLDGKPAAELLIPADQSEVMKQVDLSPQIVDGLHRLVLTVRQGLAVDYQITAWHYLPERPSNLSQDKLSIRLVLDHTELKIGESLAVTATVHNPTKEAMPMLIVDLPVPPGFALERSSLSAQVQAHAFDKFQEAGQSALLYVRGLERGKSLVVPYRLRAVMAGKVRMAPAVVYEYYNPDNRASSQPVLLTVHE